MKTSSLALAAALALAACGNPDATSAQDGPFDQDFGSTDRVAPTDARALKTSFAPVVRIAAPAVVNISARSVQRVRDPFWEFFGGGAPRARVAESIGSGVIVRPNGVVVTNSHVVAGAQEIRVTLNDRREYPATVLLADERSDIAVLQLEGADALPTVRIDDQEQLLVGDLVLAIGNPFGVGQTVTNGIISALNRTDTGIADSASFIQTDAAINPGNSGGALIDLDGDLIGINTAIFSRSGASAGVGFAVPAQTVRQVVDSAVGGETRVIRPWLGVAVQSVTSDIAQTLGLPRPQGVVVTEVYRGGPADRAGIGEGDVITAVGGQEVNDQSGLNFQVGNRDPGDTVEVTVRNERGARTVNARVDRLPGDADTDDAAVVQQGVLSGLAVLPLNPALADSLGASPFASGVIVGGVAGQGYAARYGFRRGDLIVQVNGRPATSVEAIESLPRGTEIVIERGGRRQGAVLR